MTVMVMAPFPPPIVQFRPYGARVDSSDFYGACSFATARHWRMLTIVLRNHARSNNGGMNRFHPACNSLPFKTVWKGQPSTGSHLNACVSDVNYVSLTIDGIHVCLLIFLTS
jgi:hypothetical protein